MTVVELVINEIDQQQKRYIDLAKKDKSLKKEVDAILTATTLLKMKCEQSKELEKQQAEEIWKASQENMHRQFSSDAYKPITFEQYYTETYEK